ncbi:hypothetical protein HDV00_010793 [Rhizophlyctis rosea]|nr:hypothetical protein HDV00_010793 [Rhizophlyctis rosea]
MDGHFAQILHEFYQEEVPDMDDQNVDGTEEDELEEDEKMTKTAMESVNPAVYPPMHLVEAVGKLQALYGTAEGREEWLSSSCRIAQKKEEEAREKAEKLQLEKDKIATLDWFRVAIERVNVGCGLTAEDFAKDAPSHNAALLDLLRKIDQGYAGRDGRSCDVVTSMIYYIFREASRDVLLDVRGADESILNNLADTYCSLISRHCGELYSVLSKYHAHSYTDEGLRLFAIASRFQQEKLIVRTIFALGILRLEGLCYGVQSEYSRFYEGKRRRLLFRWGVRSTRELPPGGQSEWAPIAFRLTIAERIQKQKVPSESCWVILYGNVYDVTSFVPSHPGGTKIIYQLAGTDATEEYDPIHPSGTLEESLSPSARIGVVDPATLPHAREEQRNDSSTAQSGTTTAAQSTAVAIKGPNVQYVPTNVNDCLNMDDIENLATQKIPHKCWAYYYSASDDLYTKSHNTTVYRQILLRPRIFLDITTCSTATTFLGHPVSLPIFIAPAAMARLAHPDGEQGTAKACSTFGAMQIISNNASQTPEEIVAGAKEGQIFGWQLYVQTDRTKSERMLARINKLKAIKFVVLTLDAAVPGKREHDERASNVGAKLPNRPWPAITTTSTTTHNLETGIDEGSAKVAAGQDSGGVGKSLFQGTASDLTWSQTLPWLRQHTHLPIVLKGLQTHEDAYIATHHPSIKAIILSNHGGRALDTAPPAVHTLLEIRKYCPEVFGKLEVWIDGGIRRGTDVVKALCLGARGVGVGRPVLFGLGAGGREGVERVLEILKAEMESCMRLLGVRRVEELGMHFVNTRAVERDIYDGPSNLDASKTWVGSKAKL